MEDQSITLVSAYYDQPYMMEEWWERLREYLPWDLEDRDVKVRICDDHSNKHPLEVPDDIKEMFDIQTFRLKSDMPWQEMVCRNVCMKHVAGWALLLDPDYMIHAEEMKKLLGIIKRQKNIYQPAQRNTETKEPFGRSGNLFLIHSADYWEAGGYDEQFAGGYGFSDSVFWRCVESVAKCQKHLLDDIWLDHYPMGGKIIDAASPGVRDITRNRPIFETVIANMRRYGDSGYISRRERFNFEWERVV